jgi:hypothetical protein
MLNEVQLLISIGKFNDGINPPNMMNRINLKVKVCCVLVGRNNRVLYWTKYSPSRE